MNKVFINSDTWNFWLGRTPEDMTLETVKKDVDYYTAAGGVEAIFYNMNFQRCFFPTKVGTPIWKDCELDKDGNMWLRGQKVTQNPEGNSYIQLAFNCKALWEKHPDFMQIRYDYCHSKGVEMWHSMRMNDVHHSVIHQEDLPQHADLWRERKDLLRAWYRHFERQEWCDNCFDYGQKEVREYHLGIAREYLLDYESDGIELDWLRCAPIFKPGFDELNTPILTQFMRDIKALAKEAETKWGHRVRVAARVPARVNDAIGMGMDVTTWCKEGLIDVLIPSPYHHSTEGDTEVQLWKIVAPGVILAPCINYSQQSCPGYMTRINAETDFGFASNFYQQGADTIYFYNHFPNQSSWLKDGPSIFAICSDRNKVQRQARRHVVTKHERTGEGKFESYCYPLWIWGHCANGGVNINVGDGVQNRKAKVIVGASVPLDVDVRVNTVKCLRLPDNTPLPSPLPEKKANYVQAEIPIGILHDGWNNVELFNNLTETLCAGQIVWMEINIEAE